MNRVNYIDTAIDFLNGTEAGKAAEAIRDFYASIQPELDCFMEDVGVACPSACGECCAHFIPDVTSSEALLIAITILFGEHKSQLQYRLKAVNPTRISCPFYDAGNNHHCMIYKERPLVCRLFNSCLSSGKNGEAEFRNCRFNKDAQPVSIDKIATFRSYKPMSDYGVMLENLEGNSVETELLPQAIEEAINKIGNILSCRFADSSSVNLAE